MKRTRIKICGITRSEDARHAVAAGADAIGLVFWQPSPRAVSIAAAAEICADLPAFVNVVALTVDADAALIQNITDRLPVDIFQLHGKESPQQCRQLSEQTGRPFMKAIRVKPGLDLAAEVERYQHARSILLDAYSKGVPGGTGQQFEWQLIPQTLRSRIVLAGGLNPENVAKAVNSVHPYAVDVSGGVEASPGIKDSRKMDDFVAAVRLADNSNPVN